jgi:signal transduction histidine kinase
MKVRNKILLSILSIVFVLVVVTYFVFTYVTYNRIKATFSEDLLSNYYTVSVFNELRKEDSVKGSLVLSESPRLKAVAELGDSSTALQLMREINEGLGADIFILTDDSGTPLVELYSTPNTDGGISGYPTISEALNFASSASVVRLRNDVYRIATSPVTIGPDLLGTITIGFTLTRDEIHQLERMTNSSVVLVSDADIIAATRGTLPRPIVMSMTGKPNRDIHEFEIAGDQYLGTPFFLTDNIAYIVTKSIQDELDATLTPLRQALLALSLFVLALAAVIGSIISRSIGKPIEKLVEATNEISEGRYGYLSNITSRDELGVLSRKFDEMSVSLKEKIDELARLNVDLQNRNEDLERAFRKLRETQEELVRSERLAATGKLTAQLSHEINNPIHNIQSCLETALERTRQNGGNPELIEVALEEVMRMSRLTRQMLTFYRTTMNDETFEIADMSDIVRQTLALSKETLDKQHIRCRCTFAREQLPIHCSPEKLKQVFFNILLNAKDAMPDGGEIFIATRADNGNALVAFRDTGTGISRENLHKIFDAFFTTKSQVKGVGLGLSVSYGIVKQHNGTIEAMSEPGRGATFTIRIPLGTEGS